MTGKAREFAGLLLAVLALCAIPLGLIAAVWWMVTDTLPPVLYWRIGAVVTLVAVVLYAVAIWPILGERDYLREQIRKRAT